VTRSRRTKPSEAAKSYADALATVLERLGVKFGDGVAAFGEPLPEPKQEVAP